MDLTSASRYLSLLLRHHPEKAGIALDEHGWADVGQLIEGVAKTRPFDLATLEEIVRTDNKQRYSFNDDHTLIRANQGHSIPVDVELLAVSPPEFLFHGTGRKYTDSIACQGLLPRGRLYVHLSADLETAEQVGRRHGSPVVYRVLSGKMERDGQRFYCSVNGVWLTDRVDVKYLERLPNQAGEGRYQ